MALGDLTKQIAQQAILSATSKDPPPAAPPDNVAAMVLAQVSAMQKALKEDEELAVMWRGGTESIRVMEIFAPSRHLLVLSGMDAERNVTRVIAAVDSLQLVCKVVKTAAGAKPARVGLITAKA